VRTHLDDALRLLAFGYGPVPIKDKRPLVKWRDLSLLRTVTEADVREWWSTFPDASIALITGWQYDLVVVDTDTPEAEEWAKANLRETPRVVQTRRGWHRYYRHPGLETRSKAHEVAPGILVDVKGDRAQCTAPGSVHPSGHVYRATRRWSKDDKLPLLPKEIARVACIFPAPKPVQVPRETSSDSATRLRQFLNKHPLPEVGCGSDRATFNAAVFALMVGCDEIDFVNAVTARTGWDERWVGQKYRSAARRAS
jgi:hypothetical protein